jgi:hypothetical protein
MKLSSVNSTRSAKGKRKVALTHLDMHRWILKCLPHLASLEIENRVDPVPYAIVTTDAYHMNTGYDLV